MVWALLLAPSTVREQNSRPLTQLLMPSTMNQVSFRVPLNFVFLGLLAGNYQATRRPNLRVRAGIRAFKHRRQEAQQPARHPAVASLRGCLRFEPAGDGGGSERSPWCWSQAWPRCC